MKHVALVHRPYLDAILDGSKTVEVRLSRARNAPYQCIRRGDRIFFKQTSGPYRAAARVRDVEFFEGLTPADVRRLERRVRANAGGRPAYWRRHENASYASLIWLENVRAARRGPTIPRLWGRAWVVIDNGAGA